MDNTQQLFMFHMEDVKVMSMVQLGILILTELVDIITEVIMSGLGTGDMVINQVVIVSLDSNTK